MRPLLSALSLFSVQLEHGRNPLDAALQFRLVKELADDSRRSRGLLRRLRYEPPRGVLDQEQLAILARMAITYAEGDDWPSDGNMLLLEAILAFNSLRSADIMSRTTSEITRLLFIEVRASANDVDNKADVLRRYGAFVSWARSDDARTSRSFIDLDRVVERALEMSYLDFAAATIAFYSNFGARIFGPGGKRTNYPFLDTEAFLSSVEHPEMLRQWLGFVTLPLPDAKAKLLEAPLSASIVSLEQFMATPLLSDDGNTYCPALRYLPNVAGNGFLFRLGQFLEISQDKKASDRLRGFHGDFLEAYVTDLLRAAMKNRECRIFRERVFGKSEQRTSDIALFYNDEAVFVDINSKRFNNRDSIIGLGIEAIRRDLEKMIASKIRKIARRARDFQDRKFTYEGIEPDAIKRVTGIVVTPQGLPRVVGITNMLDELLPTVPEGLAQWEFVELSEMEVLPRMFGGELDIADLIENKLADEAGRRRSLTNFLWFRDRERLRDHRTEEEVLADPWFQEVLERAQSWGLRADSKPEESG